MAGCERKENPKPEPEQSAGKGGATTFKITPKHHGRNIDSATIYIKYNTQDLPSTYDDSAKCVMENGKPVATFSGLKKGKYYLYGKGWDPSISEGVKGGVPQNITEEKTYEITLPVTEGD